MATSVCLERSKGRRTTKRCDFMVSRSNVTRRMMVSFTIIVVLSHTLSPIIFSSAAAAAAAAAAHDDKDGDDTCPAEQDGGCYETKTTPTTKYQGPCSLYLAETTTMSDDDDDDNDDGGRWGLFSGVTIPRAGVPVGHGDVALHVVDPSGRLERDLGRFAVDGRVTGGHLEGRKVRAVLPGLGMAQADRAYHETNVLAYRSDVDEADLPRTTSPGAGAVTHHHNMTYYATKPIEAGDELFVFYKQRHRHNVPKQQHANSNNNSNDTVVHRRTLGWLQRQGVCVDALRAKKSTRQHLGRGAIATRRIPKGQIVTTSPLLPLPHQKSLKNKTNFRHNNKAYHVGGTQLLLNYCFGGNTTDDNSSSSLLLYPYGPLVNLINHDGTAPNAEIRWSANSGFGRHPTIDYVALRDIQRDDEVLIDYGTEWEQAWERHVVQWVPPPLAEQYAPSYVYDDVVAKIRTAEEQEIHPYPDNLMTSCFYRYHATTAQQQQQSSDENARNKKETTTVRWKVSRGLFDFENLRPCSILSREDNVILRSSSSSNSKTGNDNSDEPQSLYMVLIRNMPGSSLGGGKDEDGTSSNRIPKGVRHVVTHVPRYALRFTDRPYTTDQHLENTFRHPMGLPKGMLSEAWTDLHHHNSKEGGRGETE